MLGDRIIFKNQKWSKRKIEKKAISNLVNPKAARFVKLKVLTNSVIVCMKYPTKSKDKKVCEL